MNPLWTIEDITEGDCLLRIPFRFDDAFHPDCWRLDVQVPEGSLMLAVQHPQQTSVPGPTLLFLGNPEQPAKLHPLLIIGSGHKIEHRDFYLNRLPRLASFGQPVGRLGASGFRIFDVFSASTAIAAGVPHEGLPAIARRTTLVEQFGHYRRS